MKPTTLFKGLLGLLFFLYLIPTIQAQAPGSKPNIVIIMIDDGRYDELRPTGAPDWFIAPNLERIANEGVNFNRTYAPTPLCGPSRASVYTGRYSHQHGTYNNGDDFDTTLPMIQKILSADGYYTGFIGKYGNGFPQPQEFDYWVDIGDAELYKNTWIKVNGENVWVSGHITDSFNQYIEDFMDSAAVHSDKPFLLFFFPLAPHTPNTPRSIDATKYVGETMPFPVNFYNYTEGYPSFYDSPGSVWVKDTSATEKFIGDRYRCLIGVEDNVSRIFNWLDAKNQTDSTFIMFTSDNGYIIGEHKMRAKALPIEESIRVPMYVRYPAWFPEHQEIDNDMVELLDIPKTLLDVAGIPDTYGFMGHSLHDIAAPDTLRPYVFYEYEGAEPDAANQVPDLRGIRSLDYMYVYSECDCWTEELYDFSADPLQDTNQIFSAAHYPIVQQYRNILDSMRIAYGDVNPFLSLDCYLVNSHEVPDGIDNDCDAIVDDSLDAFVRYIDFDGDGYGSPDSSIIVFGELAGYVNNAFDCSDANNSIHPSAVEICDLIDNDCDGLIDMDDPDIIGLQIWYFDADLDGFGDSTTALTACFAPLGYILNGSDCDDTNPFDTLAYVESCNAIDDDCDGLIDDFDGDIIGQLIWYADMDADGVGDFANNTVACFAPDHFVDNYGDCNDADAGVTHGSPEVCNTVDDDCDGLIDDADADVSGRSWYFMDADGDGFGNQLTAALFCFGASGYVIDSTDCNDASPTIFPIATEICDGIDNNCNGLIDDADPTIVGQSIWYADVDGDGYGNGLVTTLSCYLPAGYTTNALDCNDLNNAIRPLVPDYCDGINNDCDLVTDEDAVIPIITAAGPTTFCSGSNVTLTASPIISGFTYQWFKSASPISGATGASFVASSAGSYKVRYTAPAGCTTFSLFTTITVNSNPKPTVSNSSASNDLCINNPVKLSCKNKIGSSYQWYKGATPLAGATTNKYNATTTGNYKVRQTDATGCFGTSSAFSVVQTCKDVAPYFDDTETEFSIAPNPNEGSFNLYIDFNAAISGETTIRIYSMLGDLVYEAYLYTDAGVMSEYIQIPAEIAGGVYMVEATLQQQRLIREMVIE